MPELPEVETIKNDARVHLLGRKLTAAHVLDPTLVRRPAPEEFATRLSQTRFVSADRRGKYLLLRLDSGDSLVLQLAITGQFLLLQPAIRMAKHTRLIMDLEDGAQLRLVDANGYAKAHLLATDEPGTVLGLDELGPDPTAPDFTLAALRTLLQGHRGRLKPLLLDQHFLAGLGNIYVDEALFAAGIHPARQADSLQPEEISRLHEAIVRILLAAIAHRGTTIATYRDLLGRPGHYQEELRVFRRTGQPCPRCGDPVELIQLGGRDTHHCPRCQV
jgi:formamidopyrimidine-DNA glycosylase